MIDKHANLFAPVDRGEFTLPPKLLAMREGVHRLQTEPLPDLVTDLDEHARLIEENITAAVDGGPLPDTTAIQAARLSCALATDRQSVLIAAANSLELRIGSEIQAAGDQIITEHLAPAHAKVIEEIKETLTITEQYADDPASALTASTKVRTAFAALPGLNARLNVLGSARRVIEATGYRPTKDQDGEFVFVRNINEVWPPRLRHHNNKPWPDGDAGIAWLIRHDAQLWMPTATQMDARWQEVYGEALEQRRKDQHDLSAYRAIA